MDGAWCALNAQYAKPLGWWPKFVPAACYACEIDSLNHIRGYLETVSNSCSNMRKLLDTKGRTTADNQQTTWSMLMIKFRFCMGPNLQAGVESAATLNRKRIGRVIGKLQQCSFPWELPVTSTKGIIGVNVSGNTEVIEMDGERQSASCRPIWKKTKTTHYEADVSDEYILLRLSKRHKTTSTTSKAWATMQTSSGGTKAKKRERMEGSKETYRQLVKGF